MHTSNSIFTSCNFFQFFQNPLGLLPLLPTATGSASLQATSFKSTSKMSSGVGHLNTGLFSAIPRHCLKNLTSNSLSKSIPLICPACHFLSYKTATHSPLFKSRSTWPLVSSSSLLFWSMILLSSTSDNV